METVSSRLNMETINLFRNVLKEKRSEVVRELVEYGKKGKAVDLYKMKKVSLGLGAKLAGMNLSDFLDLLEEHNIKLNLTLDDAKMAMKNADKLL